MDEDRALVIACHTIGVRRPGLARWLSRLSAGVLVALPVLASVSAIARALNVAWPLDLLDVHIDGIIWAWLAATPSLALFSVLIGAPVRTRAGKLVVDAGGVRASAGGSSRFYRAQDIVGGLVLPATNGSAVELHLSDGRVLGAVVESDGEAYAVLERLGVGPDRRRVAVTLGSSNRALAAGCVTFPIAAIVWTVVIIAIVPHGSSGWMVAAVWALAVTVSTLLARRAWTPAEVTIGVDGVLVRGAWKRPRFVPFAAIDRVLAIGTTLRIDLLAPEVEEIGERIRLTGSDAALTAGLVDRISDAMNVERGAASAAAAAHLDPAGRPFAEWREALAKLLNGGASYRRAALEPDELLAVLDDASAPPARRIGAALALRDAHPEARSRVRIAADACADEAVRAALEAAAEEEIDEAPIRRALGG